MVRARTATRGGIERCSWLGQAPLLLALLASPLLACATGAPLGAQPMVMGGAEPNGFGSTPAPLGVGEGLGGSLGSAGPAQRQQVVTFGRALLGHRRISLAGHVFGSDCTGLVRAVFAQVGVDVLAMAKPGDNGVSAIFRLAQAKGRVFTDGRPLPGDLVFFRDTYDGSRNELTHVGLVESVDENGTVSVIHRVHTGVVRYHMNLAHPGERVDPGTGQPLNDFLRVAGRTGTPTLTGELFASFGSLLPEEATQAVSHASLPALRPQPVNGSI